MKMNRLMEKAKKVADGVANMTSAVVKAKEASGVYSYLGLGAVAITNLAELFKIRAIHHPCQNFTHIVSHLVIHWHDARKLIRRVHG